MSNGFSQWLGIGLGYLLGHMRHLPFEPVVFIQQNLQPHLGRFVDVVFDNHGRCPNHFAVVGDFGFALGLYYGIMFNDFTKSQTIVAHSRHTQ
jgi:hypothetical protein